MGPKELTDLTNLGTGLERLRRMASAPPETVFPPPTPIPAPAKVVMHALWDQILRFQGRLSDCQEVGVALATFGNDVIHLEGVGCHGHHLVILHGKTTSGAPARLVLHHTQVQVLLLAVQVEEGKEPRRIGFASDVSGGSANE